MKYIPAGKLIAEIERRIDKHEQESKTGSFYAFAKGMEDKELLSFIESLEKGNIGQLGKDGPMIEFVGEPEPQELDEAAKQIAFDVCKDLYNGQEKDTIVYYAILAAISMAKWMAEQGVSMEITDETKWIDVDTFVHRNCDGTTIIQIRKKEE